MPNHSSRIIVFLFVLVVLVGMVVACSSATLAPTAVPPSPPPTVDATATAQALAVATVNPVQFEEGRDLVAENCTGCHTLERVESTRQSRAEWLKTMDKMITT